MGRSIPGDKEAAIRKLLRRGRLSLREIADKVGCCPNTVRAVKRRKPKRPPEEAEEVGQVTFREVSPYLCLDCSERAGRVVLVTYEPCVACAARGVQHPAEE